MRSGIEKSEKYFAVLWGKGNRTRKKYGESIRRKTIYSSGQEGVSLEIMFLHLVVEQLSGDTEDCGRTGDIAISRNQYLVQCLPFLFGLVL